MSSNETGIEVRGSQARILDQHRALAAKVRRLKENIHLDELVELLDELAPELRHHFAEEEDPAGIFQTIGDFGPHFSNAVERIKREHKEMLSTTEDLAEVARSCLKGPIARIVRDASELADRLEQHEVRETELLAEAMNTDLGRGV